MKRIFAIVIGSIVLLGNAYALDLRLPFDGSWECTQNSNDGPTHNKDGTLYDLDFGLDRNTPIVAARSGVVIEVKTGCVEPNDRHCGGKWGNYRKKQISKI